MGLCQVTTDDYKEICIRVDTHDGEHDFRANTAGWIPPVNEGIERQPPELTDSEKLEYIYQVAVKIDAAVREVLPQVGPFLESVSKNPMLKMFLR